MKKGAAIVTGASSGIGLAVSKALCDLGYEVYGIGREFQDRPSSGRFHPLCCDLLDTDRLCALVKEVSSKEQICALINNAGCAYYGLHEELSPKKIQQMVRTNLEVPLILSSLLLRQLKKQGGFIVNISSVTAGASNPHGCAYGATKAGLSSFSRSLLILTYNVFSSIKQLLFHRSSTISCLVHRSFFIRQARIRASFFVSSAVCSP